MTQSGLKPVLDPSSFFAESAASGTGAPAVCVTMEGTRPLLVEIQALCSEIQGGNENQKYIRCGRFGFFDCEDGCRGFPPDGVVSTSSQT